MKQAIIIGAVILGLVGLMWWGRSNQPAGSAARASGAGALTTAEARYDFGRISMRNGLVERTFTVTNASGRDITVKKVVTSCMCTVAYLESAGREKGPFGMEGMGYVPPADEPVRAGESRAVRVVYDPNAHGPAGVGAINRFVYLTDDSGGTLELEIRAVVTP